MASFTISGPDLAGLGPVVDLAVGVPAALEAALLTAGQPIPTAVTVPAMVDTGATRSVMQTGIASGLGLNPVGSTLISTPSSTNVRCAEYAVRLALPQNVTSELTIIEAPLQDQHAQALLGRDLLAHGVLVYIGYANSWTLSF